MNNFVSFNDFQAVTKRPDIYNLSKINKNKMKQNQSAIYFPRPEMDEKLRQAKNQNGLIEKIADKIKNLFNLGSNSKKIESLIKQNKADEVVINEIKKYRQSQETASQVFADIVSGYISIFTFLTAKEKNKIPTFYAAFAAMLAGGLIKSAVLDINAIGTKQYKFEKDDKLTDKENKQIKKELRKEKRNADFRNTISGMINGITAPFIALKGFAGAALYIVINSLNRYFIASKEDSGEKSFKSYKESIKNASITNLLAAAAFLVPVYNKGKCKINFSIKLK